jgi:hypothetical protein
LTDFEDHLWSHLVDHGADRVTAHQLKPTRGRRQPLVLGASAAGLAAAAAVALALTATSATAPAYAVTDNHNGTVTLTIRQFTDRANRAAVNRELAQLDVRARVVQVQKGCPKLNMAWRYLQTSTQPWSTSPQVQHGPVGGWTVGLIPSRIPAGRTLVFALRQLTNGWEMSDAIVDGHGPNCASGYTSSLTH